MKVLKDSPSLQLYFTTKMIVAPTTIHIPAIRSAVIRCSLRLLFSDTDRAPYIRFSNLPVNLITSLFFCYNVSRKAPVVKLADTPDLGSGARACRFKSCQAHQIRKKTYPVLQTVIAAQLTRTGYVFYLANVTFIFHKQSKPNIYSSLVIYIS